MNAILKQKMDIGSSEMASSAASMKHVFCSVIRSVAEKTMGLDVTLVDFEEKSVSTKNIAQYIGENDLFCEFISNSSERGIAIMDCAVMSYFSQKMTFGSIINNDIISRTPTQTDLSIHSPFFDAVFEGVMHEMNRLEMAPLLPVFYASQLISQKRMIPILFEEQSFQLYSLKFDIDGADSPGHVIFAFPKIKNTTRHSDEDLHWQEQFQSSVMESFAQLDNVIYRYDEKLSNILGLQVGDEIQIPKNALENVGVWAGNNCIAKAKLGKMNDLRAIQIKLDRAEIFPEKMETI